MDIHFNTRVGDLEFDDGRVTALISSDGRRFACDYALLAVPYLTLRAGQISSCQAISPSAHTAARPCA